MIIQCDFDGTIIRNNLSVVLREKFARGNWQKIDADYLDGHLTVEESNRLQFTLIKEPKEKLQEVIRQHIEVKPGFIEFVNYCRERDIPFVIVSSGLDFYIETVLAQIGMLDLELYSGRTSFGKDGIAVTYRDPEGNLINKGFKETYLAWLRKRDNYIIYMGDGLSDLTAARRADHVFATSYLLKVLNTEPVACSAFSDFIDLQQQMRRLL